MMTALLIEEHKNGFLRYLRRNRIRVEHRYCDAATLKCVTYEHYRGKINWTSIDRFVKAQRNRVLCAPDMEIARNSGYKRFVSSELSRRMCENAALYLLRSVATPKMKVVLVDEEGDCAGLCEYLAQYCDPVNVLSPAAKIYAAQAEYLLNEKGASLRLCRDKACLHDADLVIAPRRLEEALPCPSDALILSGEAPAVPQNAATMYEYFFDLPSKFREICPDFLDEMYFASALYSMAGARELGGEVFTRCGDGVTIHTRASLTEAFKNRLISRSNS
ncbi:hypothetical protein [uncultured Ruminococcus sp.]|uniref:hypothetical protein n=1 Tax=uncultured Ruminococcus sp. TaxID=165186 RepID=UPI00292EC756|nr:hypothetical protein [uncultured Ruminococcus sp.]